LDADGLWAWPRLGEIKCRTTVVSGKQSQHLEMKFPGVNGEEM
jgi:hypothetical protein